MTHDDRLDLLREWHKRGRALEAATEKFCDLLGIEDLEGCPLLGAAWRMWDSYTASVAARVGDGFNWLNWWWFDAKRGKGTCEARAASWPSTKPIRTLKDLLAIIEADLPDAAQ